MLTLKCNYFIQFLLQLELIQRVYGLRCMECVDMPTPADCNRITTCGPSEQCYVDQYISSGGIILYQSGCRSQFRCAGPGRKRFLTSSSDVLTCSQCCNNAEFCNIEGCGAKAPRMPQRGLYCFECIAQKSPDSCRDIVTCDSGNTCLLEKVNNDPLDIYYRSRCIEESACVGIETVAQMMTGRRRRTVEHCPKCCRTDFCNDNCVWNDTYTNSTTPIAAFAVGPSGASQTNQANSLIMASTTNPFIASSGTSTNYQPSHSTGPFSSTSKNSLSVKPVSNSPTSKYVSSNISSSASTILSSKAVSSSVNFLTLTQTSVNATSPSVSSVSSSKFSSAKSPFPGIAKLSTTSKTVSSKLPSIAAVTSSGTTVPPSVNSVTSVTSRQLAVFTTSHTLSSSASSYPSVSSLPVTTNSSSTSIQISSKVPLRTSTTSPGTKIASPINSVTIPTSTKASFSKLSLAASSSPVTTKSPVTHLSSSAYWSSWGSWMKCHCQDFTQTRRRHCHHHNHHQQCHGASEEHRHCSGPNHCHVDKHRCNTTAGYVPRHISSGTFCIKLYQRQVTWMHAQQQCHADDPRGHVVVINSFEREQALKVYLNHLHGYSQMSALWLGIHFYNNQWRWSNGEHKPNNYTEQFFHTHRNPYYHCAGRLPSGDWTQLHCSEEHDFVCEIPM